MSNVQYRLPRQLLVLGASYVGQMDDLAVFSRLLTDKEVNLIYGQSAGVGELARK